MPTPNVPFLEVTEINEAIVVRFVDRKVLNDHKMELMAKELFALADTLGTRELRLDFGNVEYLQSSALGKLVGLAKKIATAGGRLVLCNIHDDVYKAFTVTNLDKLFTIERVKSSEPEA
jgi:anti-sigma B factor antagonist